jgi:Flp pilus assembly protein TadG
MTLPITHRATRRPASGQALVEVAFVLPIFLLLLMILIDFGRVVYAQNAISQNAHAATRFGSVSAPQADAAIRERARLVPPGAALPDSAITGEGGLFYPDGTAEGSRVVVEIEVDVPILTPIISTVIGGSFTVTSRSEDLVRS